MEMERAKINFHHYISSFIVLNLSEDEVKYSKIKFTRYFVKIGPNKQCKKLTGW